MTPKPLWRVGMAQPWILAQQVLTDPISTGGALERMGVAAIVVVGCYYLIKYFTGQLEKKDMRLVDVTDRFLKSTERSTEVIADNRTALEQMSETMGELRRAVDRLAERRTSQRE